MKFRLENIAHLDNRESAEAQFGCDGLARAATLRPRSLSEFAHDVQVRFPKWFVYQGGSHVAVHKSPGVNSPRIAIFHE